MWDRAAVCIWKPGRLRAWAVDQLTPRWSSAKHGGARVPMANRTTPTRKPLNPRIPIVKASILFSSGPFVSNEKKRTHPLPRQYHRDRIDMYKLPHHDSYLTRSDVMLAPSRLLTRCGLSSIPASLLHGYYSHCPSLPSPGNYRPNDEVSQKIKKCLCFAQTQDDLFWGFSDLVRVPRRGVVSLQKRGASYHAPRALCIYNSIAQY